MQHLATTKSSTFFVTKFNAVRVRISRGRRIATMSSWANVLKAPAAAPAESAPPSTASDGPSNIAVVDANNIISGIRLERIASKVVTIPEVLEEIRDKQSRQFLATLPFGIETKEPNEESVKAGEAWVVCFCMIA